MAVNIRGKNDGINGRNDNYVIAGRGEVTRAKLVKEVNLGNHPLHTTYERNGTTYVRAIRDNKEFNNINKN